MRSIISSIEKAKYYSILFDMTPDNVHIEQMSKIVRFAEIQRDWKSGKLLLTSFHLMWKLQR
jgi:hypothetical protein